jgi:hypothetical protein
MIGEERNLCDDFHRGWFYFLGLPVQQEVWESKSDD